MWPISYTEVYAYKNIKRKLYKTNAAIWFNKTCRVKQLTPNYINIKEPVAASAVEVPDDERHNARNMLNY